jgi:hypothetical protein
MISTTPHKPRRSGHWTLLLTTAVLVALAALFAPSVLLPHHKTFVSMGTPSGTATAYSSSTQQQYPPNSLANTNSDTAPLSSQTSTTTYTIDIAKREWPELVGTDGNVAARTIQGENPSIEQVTVLPQDAMVTMDYVPTRVRIFVNEDNNKVARTPRTG